MPTASLPCCLRLFVLRVVLNDFVKRKGAVLPGKRLFLHDPFLHLVFTLVSLCVAQAQPSFAQDSGKLLPH